MARVLLLEDSELFAAAARRSLTAHEVVHVTTVEAAIRAIDSGGIDCALVDLNLTDTEDYSGAEVLSHIKATHPKLPRAVVTGSRLKGAIYKGLMQRFGVSEVIIKGDVDREGFGTTDLVESVAALLNGSDARTRESAASAIREHADTAATALRERIEILSRVSPGMGVPMRRSKGRQRKRLEMALKKLEEACAAALASAAAAPAAEIFDVVEDARQRFEAILHEQ